MRIEQTSRFRKDFRKLQAKHYDMQKLKEAVGCLVENDGEVLRSRYRDHALKGSLAGYRELHIERDWLLVYSIDNERLVLFLLRTGKHEEVL